MFSLKTLYVLQLIQSKWASRVILHVSNALVTVLDMKNKRITHVCTGFWVGALWDRLWGGLQAVQQAVDFIPQMDQFSTQVLHLRWLQWPRLPIHCEKHKHYFWKHCLTLCSKYFHKTIVLIHVSMGSISNQLPDISSTTSFLFLSCLSFIQIPVLTY